jgi:hypothetical protein
MWTKRGPSTVCRSEDAQLISAGKVTVVVRSVPGQSARWGHADGTTENLLVSTKRIGFCCEGTALSDGEGPSWMTTGSTPSLPRRRGRTVLPGLRGCSAEFGYACGARTRDQPASPGVNHRHAPTAAALPLHSRPQPAFDRGEGCAA